MAEYVSVQQGDLPPITVSQKAYEEIYRQKPGFRLLGTAESRADVDGDGTPDVDDDVLDPFDAQVARASRSNVADALAWVDGAEDQAERTRRASALFQREQEGRKRSSLLDALAAVVTPGDTNANNGAGDGQRAGSSEGTSAPPITNSPDSPGARQ